MGSEKFTVDTHLFRELGELLVGRDSTALIELIKNSYDADATEVTVHGQHLDDPRHGVITVVDNGLGMTPSIFKDGFLRIASRIKDEGHRRSVRYKRRFTGAKGIGRLAAHKLAKLLKVTSVPSDEVIDGEKLGVEALIDWNLVEKQETLDDLANTDAVQVKSEDLPARREEGTTIELRQLRKKWTSVERARFFAEVGTYNPPEVLLKIPENQCRFPLLFDAPRLADQRPTDPGFCVKLTGEFE